jgi:hypothetical protein
MAQRSSLADRRVELGLDVIDFRQPDHAGHRRHNSQLELAAAGQALQRLEILDGAGNNRLAGHPQQDALGRGGLDLGQQALAGLPHVDADDLLR